MSAEKGAIAAAAAAAAAAEAADDELAAIEAQIAAAAQEIEIGEWIHCQAVPLMIQ